MTCPGLVDRLPAGQASSGGTRNLIGFLDAFKAANSPILG
jgi:hypothetical protein